MSSLDEIRNVRIKKLKKLRESGIDPFPSDTEASKSVKELILSFGASKKQKRDQIVAGRIMAIREHGGSLFFDLYDGTGSMQMYLKKDDVGDESYSLFKETIDVGDFCEVRGSPFVTKKKEKSLLVSSWRILAKSLRPLPEKWHGLQDVEERFRKRYLDLLMNKEVRERFKVRSEIIKFIRKYLDKEGFIEVETPILQNIAGGALARPFVTHHNALDIDLYLRIAPEIYLKKLLIGGFPKVYEIGRSFRNEGIDATHNPEFTTIEVYEAYADASTHREFIEAFLRSLVKAVFKKSAISYQGDIISFTKKFNTVSFIEVLKRHASIPDYEGMSTEDLLLRAKQFGIEVEHNASKDKVADEIFKKICRPKFIQPTFVIHHPVGISPLAKKLSRNADYVDRYQLIVGGLEIANGFSELNDSIEQRSRFEEQQRRREQGDEEATQLDEEFIEALEYGMPPAAGLGIGIDRLVMLLTDTKNIREVVFFPTMRPKK